MPTFTPPLEEGPASIGGDSHPLWRYYGNYDVGATVWKDQLGNWHKSQFPYQGGYRNRDYNNNVYTEDLDTSVDSLANAQEVYMGGGKYEVTESKADELRAAGFFVGGHWTSEEAKWTAYVIASENNRGFKGGDACASVLLPTNQSIWSHADTIIGTVDAGGFVSSSTFVKNSLVVRESNGTLDGQSFAGGGISPAWNHPSGGGFTPMDMVYDGVGVGVDNILVIGWAEPSNYGQVNGEGLIMRLNVFLGAGAFTDYPLVDNPGEVFPAQGKFNVTSVYNDTVTGFHYMLGRDLDLFPVFSYPFHNFNLPAQTQYVRMARVPLGQLTTPANWQYWDGTNWTLGQEPTAKEQFSRIMDTSGKPLDGTVDLTRVGNQFILIRIHQTSPSIHCYKSSTPQGPYDLYHVADNPDRVPDAGPHPPHPKKYFSAFPKFHEYLNPDANTLVVTHSHGTYQVDFGVTPPLNHASQYTPNFVYIPTPAVA